MKHARFLPLSIILYSVTLLYLSNFIIISTATLFSFPNESAVKTDFNNATEKVYRKLLKSAGTEGSNEGTHAALHVNSTFDLETPFATRPRCDGDDSGYGYGEGGEGGFWCDHHEKCCHHNGYYHCCDRNHRCCEGRCCHGDGDGYGGDGHENGNANGNHGGCDRCSQNERCCDYNGNYNCCRYGCCYGQCCGRMAG